jgi:hypothetical protein
MGKKSGSGMKIQYNFSERNSFLGLKILKLFDAEPNPGSGMEKFRSGIRHKHFGSATLISKV